MNTTQEQQVPKVIWQTNYSNACALPVYLNYLFNRMLSLDYEYRYVSTEDREVFMKANAKPEVYDAYMKLTDGAAQADLWRLTVLYCNGGVYMDIDATLVWPLKSILKDVDNALYIKNKKNTEYTNYFLATAAENPDYQAAILQIVRNIESYDSEGVYNTTGPGVLTQILNDKNVASRDRNYVCIQGGFTNEYFQYMDKPRGKWIYKDEKKLIKK
ncbi:glycosyltransferase [Endozoicomonas sp. SESOKO1]|uniref:glycosyltransferase family 32 protein n=1 Tax=Endozoicomonas sp. SESOKO1 TaxID=2828742 RepID=UPI002147A79F